MPKPVPHVRVAIVGTGFGGIGAGARLRQEGVDDFVLFERADTLGGVWRDNVYPGAACDVQSHLYEFSFAPNPHWSRRFSPQAEIRAYLHDVADAHSLTDHIRFGHEVTAAQWDDDAARWHIATSEGDWTANLLIAAPGALAEPRSPELPGLDSFDGPVMHTARWDDAVSVTHRRVAVIGTGASAIQLVPAIQPDVQHLTLFQRTPPWIIPRGDRPVSGPLRALFERVPAMQRLLRLRLYLRHEFLGLAFRNPWVARLAQGLSHLHRRRQIDDLDLRERLRPDYRLGCKRLLLSDDYYPTITRPNVTVVDGAATEIRPHGVVGPDGTEHLADVLVFATGFHVADFPFARLVTGRDGRRLSDVWAPSPTAHAATTVAGFPNFFVLQGPNSGLGHSSVILMIEAQVEHAINALRTMERDSLTAVEPTLEAQAAFVEETDRMSARTVWTTGCDSWYLDETGRNAALWPGSVPAFRRRIAPFDPDEYHLRPASPPTRSESDAPATPPSSELTPSVHA